MVDRDVRELVDPVLRHLEPVAGAFCLTDGGLEQLESGLGLAHVVASFPASVECIDENDTWARACSLAGSGKTEVCLVRARTSRTRSSTKPSRTKACPRSAPPRSPTLPGPPAAAASPAAPARRSPARSRA